MSKIKLSLNKHRAPLHAIHILNTEPFNVISLIREFCDDHGIKVYFSGQELFDAHDEIIGLQEDARDLNIDHVLFWVE